MLFPSLWFLRETEKEKREEECFFSPAFSQQPHGSSLMKREALDLIQIITKSKQNFKIKTNSEESIHLFGCKENEGNVEK
jgi:hypothetical protein